MQRGGEKSVGTRHTDWFGFKVVLESGRGKTDQVADDGIEVFILFLPQMFF